MKAYLNRITPTASKPAAWDSFNYWSNTPKFAVSFLKAMYGDAAKKENDWAFHYLPKVDRNYSWTQIWDNMYRGSVKGMFAFGMNGVAIGPDSQKNIEALKKADWLVVGEIYPDETSEFWRSPGITPEEMKKINTTVYRLPCAGFAEKDGSMTNSARWLQWKNVAVPPPGEARLDQDIVAQIFLKVRELYKKEGGKFPDPILNPDVALHRSPTSFAGRSRQGDQRQGAGRSDRSEDAAVTIKAGQQLPGFRLAEGRRHDLLRQLDLFRILDRGRHHDSRVAAPKIRPAWASIRTGRGPGRRTAACCTTARPAIRPASPGIRRGKQVWWNEAAQLWVGNDVPDFKADSHPKDHMGPFIMNAGGRGPDLRAAWRVRRRAVPGALRTDREPGAESRCIPTQSNNPVVKKFTTPADKYGTPGDGFNIICTTYRLTEHYHYWTKNNPMNVQLIPEPFVEIPVELADELGIKGGDKVKVTSARSYYIAKAFVTKRIKPMMIDGKKIYQIGMPIHQGYRGIQEDEGKNARTIANRLTPTVVDPNAYTPEFKGFLVKVEKA